MASGRLVVMYQGASVPSGPQRVYVRYSSDGGMTWSKRTDIDGGPLGTNAAFGAAVGSGTGDVRLWYQDDRNGAAGWNTWFRSSVDGGESWSPEERLSNRPTGAPYKSSAGFAQPYGDYGEIAISNTGRTIAVWGEGASYTGPGGTWYDRLDRRGPRSLRSVTVVELYCPRPTNAIELLAADKAGVARRSSGSPY